MGMSAVGWWPHSDCDSDRVGYRPDHQCPECRSAVPQPILGEREAVHARFNQLFCERLPTFRTCDSARPKLLLIAAGFVSAPFDLGCPKTQHVIALSLQLKHSCLH